MSQDNDNLIVTKHWDQIRCLYPSLPPCQNMPQLIIYWTIRLGPIQQQLFMWILAMLSIVVRISVTAAEQRVSTHPCAVERRKREQWLLQPPCGAFHLQGGYADAKKESKIPKYPNMQVSFSVLSCNEPLSLGSIHAVKKMGRISCSRNEGWDTYQGYVANNLMGLFFLFARATFTPTFFLKTVSLLIYQSRQKLFFLTFGWVNPGKNSIFSPSRQTLLQYILYCSELTKITVGWCNYCVRKIQ